MNILEDQETILEVTNNEHFVANANRAWANEKLIKFNNLSKRRTNNPERGEFYDFFGHQLKVGDFCIKFEGGNGCSLYSYPCYIVKFTPKMTKIAKCNWGTNVQESCVDSNNLVHISAEEMDNIISRMEAAQK